MIEREGILFLQCSGDEKWKQVSIKLNGKELSVRGDGTVQTHDLDEVKGAKTAYTDRKYSFSLQFHDDSKSVFHADSPQERNDWVAAINSAVTNFAQASKEKSSDEQLAATDKGAATKPQVEDIPKKHKRSASHGHGHKVDSLCLLFSSCNRTAEKGPASWRK